MKRILGISVIVSVLLLAILIGMSPLPDPLFEEKYATTLHGRDGTLLSAMIASDMQWRFPSSDSLPRKFDVAIRMYEDEWFYQHPGVNPVSLFRAMKQNREAGRIVSGGSTLSMQTIRMSLGNNERTYVQKFIEIFSTFKLELLFSKNEIIRKYADHAPFGGNIVGLSAAAYRYFGRSPFNLSWAETAMLAVLPNHPSNVFPGKNEHVLLEKRNKLLDKIHSRGYLTTGELLLSKAEPLPQRLLPLPKQAYHLLHRAVVEGKKGQKVISSLDPILQARVNSIVNKYSASMTTNEIHNAAAIVLEINSGNTLAYIGNAQNPGYHGQHVDIITAPRSPGSLLKPILYAAAIDDGLILPTQLLPDIPIFHEGFNPKNFNKNYQGAVPADEALTSSLNVPFVHLLWEYGHEKFLQKLQKIGFRSFNKPANHYGLSLILGGAETSLWEITGVYASLARAQNNFLQRPYKKGYSLDDYRPNQYLKVHDNADLDLQNDGILRIPSLNFAFKAMQKLERPEEETGWQYYGSSRSISWKTGTSFGFRDGWAIGFDRNHLVGIWVGNADGEGRPGLTGIKTAAPLMFKVFEALDPSPGIDLVLGSPELVCANSGMKAGVFCANTREVDLPGYLSTTATCDYHKVLNLTRDGLYQVNSSCYVVADIKRESRFVLPPVQAWYYRQYHPNYLTLPSYLSNCTTTHQQEVFELIYPRSRTNIKIPVEQDGLEGRAVFEAAHQSNNAKIYWHLDDQYIGSTENVHQMSVLAGKGEHLITLVDNLGNEVHQGFKVVN